MTAVVSQPAKLRLLELLEPGFAVAGCAPVWQSVVNFKAVAKP